MAATSPTDRKYPIIDFSGHILTEIPESKRELDDIIGSIHTDPEEVIDRYSAANVDGVVLSQPPFMGHDDVEATRNANDDLLEIVQTHDELYGLAALPVGAGGEAAARELERCLELGYHGGALETMSNGIELIDDELEPVFEAAERAGAPLLVHPKLFHPLQPDSEVDADQHEILTDRYKLNAIFGREAALSESICKVIHAGILDRHPDLNLVYHHLGGNIAAMLGRIHLQLDEGRFPGQDHVKSTADFKTQLEERIYLDTAGFFGYHAPIRTALETVPSTQLVFGTDAPYEPRTARELEQHWNSITDVASDTDSGRVLGQNALELLANA